MKKIYIFLPLFLVLLLVVTPISKTLKLTNNIDDKILRLHILANSDDDTDQQLKLKVRDKILIESKKLYKNCDSLESAINVTKDNLEDLSSLAKSVIAENGYNYNVDITIGREFFDIRYYENFVMPAGIYNTIKIIIGEGRGRNWWCVMYPSVCLSGCVEDFDKVLTDEEKQAILDEKFIPRLKIIEIYKKIKNSILTL